MSASTILGITEVEPTQNNKSITINNAFAALEQAANAKFTEAVSGSGPVTLNDLECTRYFYYVATGGTGNFDFVFLGEIGANNANRFFSFKNNTSYVATVKSDAAGTTVTVPAGGSVLIHQDHDDMVKIAEFDGLAVAPYDIGVFLPGQPDDGAEVAKFIAVRNMDFADNFAGSVGHCGTNPAATAAFDVLLNGSTIGSISISTSGVFTFNTTGGAVAMSAGDRLSLNGPSPQDAALANVALTFMGTRDR